MEIKVKNYKIKIIQGDITEQAVDAIVNAANPTLMGGGGVDGAIHKKGGSKILEECKQIRATLYPNGLPTGEAIITSGGNLKAKYVIHTVGPIWRGGNSGEAELLFKAYWNSLNIAKSRGLKSIAFPSISTGAYGYPIDKASTVALNAVKNYLEKENELEEVIFVLFTVKDFEVYKQKASETFNL